MSTARVGSFSKFSDTYIFLGQLSKFHRIQYTLKKDKSDNTNLKIKQSVKQTTTIPGLERLYCIYLVHYVKRNNSKTKFALNVHSAGYCYKKWKQT